MKFGFGQYKSKFMLKSLKMGIKYDLFWPILPFYGNPILGFDDISGLVVSLFPNWLFFQFSLQCPPVHV